MASAAREEKIDIGRVMQATFRALGRNAAPFLAVSLLFAGAPAFVSQYLTIQAIDQGLAGGLVNPGFGYLAATLSGYLLQAALVRSTILDLSGRPPRVAESLVEALKLILPIIGITILSWIAILAGFLLLVVPGVIAYIMFLVAVPVLVEERQGVVASMRRSARLTSGSRWRIFVLLLVLGLLYVITVTATDFIGASAMLQEGFTLALANAIVATLFALLSAAITSALYVELRTVKEGATTHGLAAIFE